MATPADADELIDLVRRSEVVPADRLESFLAQTPLPRAASGAAAVLIQAGLLTRYQGETLLAGKHKGFRLGPYRLLQPIGQGGMGLVYLAEHASLRRRVAVKVLPPALARDELALRRFYREGRAAAALDHPNVVRVHDIAQDGPIHYLVMEYAEGRNLQDLLNQAGPLPPAQAVGYAVQAAAGLQHAADQGIVHRDVKPSNLLVDAAGVVKVLDMGLARFHNDADELTRQQDEAAVLGTLDYIAPEQALAGHMVDTRADVYSLGATLYALLGGMPPFAGKSSVEKLLAHQMQAPRPLHEVRSAVPLGLSQVVETMMAKRPEDRYQTPAEAAAALAPWAAGAAAAAGSPWEALAEPAAAKPRHRRRWPWAVAAALVGGVTVAGGVWLLLDRGGRSETSTIVSAVVRPVAAAQAPRQPAATKAAPRPAEVLYRLDLSGRNPQTWRRGAQGTKQPAETPAGWVTNVRGGGATSEFLVGPLKGVLALGVRNLSGKGGGVWSLERPGPPAGRRHLIQLSYLTQGKARCVISHKPHEGKASQLAALAATNGQWRSATVYFEPPGGRPICLDFHNPAPAREGTLHFRDVRILDVGAMSEDYVVARQDWPGVKPFVLGLKGGKDVERHGQLPPGWATPTNRDPAMKGEAALEPVDGRPALALRDGGGKGPMTLAWSGHRLRPQRHYWLELEHRCAGDTGGLVRLRLATGPWTLLGNLPPTGGRWQTTRLEFTAERDTVAAVGLSPRGGNALHIGRVELVEKRTAP